MSIVLSLMSLLLLPRYWCPYWCSCCSFSCCYCRQLLILLARLLLLSLIFFLFVLLALSSFLWSLLFLTSVVIDIFVNDVAAILVILDLPSCSCCCFHLRYRWCFNCCRCCVFLCYVFICYLHCRYCCSTCLGERKMKFIENIFLNIHVDELWANKCFLYFFETLPTGCYGCVPIRSRKLAFVLISGVLLFCFKNEVSEFPVLLKMKYETLNVLRALVSQSSACWFRDFEILGAKKFTTRLCSLIMRAKKGITLSSISTEVFKILGTFRANIEHGEH